VPDFLRLAPALSLLAVAAGCTYSKSACAETQVGSGIALGVAGTGEPVAWSHTKFFGAVRGEALFGAASPGALRLGPALEVGTIGFSDLRVTAGPTLLVPLDEILALSLTPGAYARTNDGATFGLSSRAFFGVHPWNRVGSYAMSGGLLLGLDRDLGKAPESAFVVAAQVDGMLLALPVILLIEWIRGPRD
jgi:hypothetical protein